MRALDVKSSHIVTKTRHHILSSRVVANHDDSVGTVITGFDYNAGHYMTVSIVHDYNTDARTEVVHHVGMADGADINCLYGIHDANVDVLLGDLDTNVGAYHNYAVS